MALGDFLVAEGLLMPDDLSRAQATQRRYPTRRLSDILVELGFVSETELARAFAFKFHLPFIDLSECEIDGSAARRARVAGSAGGRLLVVDMDDATVTVAVSDPGDADGVDEIRLQSHRSVRMVVAPASQIRRAVRRSVASGPESVRAPREAEDVDEIVASLLETVAHHARDESEPDKAAVDEDETGVIKLVSRMLEDACNAGASDIHIEPNRPRGTMRIRFRVDGDCSIYREIPSVLATPLVARVKILAELDISEHRRPQDGKIRFRKSDDVRVELRVATIPTVGGNEDIVLRVLPPSTPRPIDAMGLNSRDLAELQRMIAAPYGLILCVGPTGSGKTTTLHSILGTLNSIDLKIWTAEDPVEITQPGLRQVQMNPKVGLDFAAAMRAFLRADPDVIMVGEMRDAETAGTAVTASLTGHLVLSTLHTNSAPETVARLLDMGLEPFSFSDALLGVLAQRLARGLCTKCRVEGRATADEVETIVGAFGGAAGLEQALGVTATNGIPVWHPVGCDACKKSGYKGRVAIVELLVVDDATRHAIAARANAEELKRLAMARGMRTLLQNGVAKVLDGTISMQQLLAVCGR